MHNGGVAQASWSTVGVGRYPQIGRTKSVSVWAELLCTLLMVNVGKCLLLCCTVSRLKWWWGSDHPPRLLG